MSENPGALPRSLLACLLAAGLLAAGCGYYGPPVRADLPGVAGPAPGAVGGDEPECEDKDEP